jgi:16S rRNA (cytidine1402-2'-O)-methyltransferase
VPVGRGAGSGVEAQLAAKLSVRAQTLAITPRLRLGNKVGTRDKGGIEVDNMAQSPSNSHPKFKREGAKAQADARHVQPQSSIKSQLPCGLYLVATPIGNLGDFSARGAKTLENADLILAEDTRVTRKLMNLYGIAGRVERCDEATTEHGISRALAVLQAGGAVAFCSDAGTPGVSDPGERLARGIIDAGFPVQAVPGASAVLAALTISGLPSAQFMFAGFAPTKAGARTTFFEGLASIKATLVFYESGPRLAASLASMLAVFGDRPSCVARELTKMFEETRRDTLSALAAFYLEQGGPRGEIVVVVGGAPDIVRKVSGDDLDALLLAALAVHRVKDAANEVANKTGLPRRDVYARAVVLSKGQ